MAIAMGQAHPSAVAHVVVKRPYACCGDRYLCPMPPELQERGVTEAAWEEFAREAEAIMRKNDICDRYHCCLPCLPMVLCWVVMTVIEETGVLEVMTGVEDGLLEPMVLAGLEVVVALLAFAVIFFLCVRLRAVGKAMHHDLDDLSQRVLSLVERFGIEPFPDFSAK